MSESYTAQAKNALALAGKTARQYQHTYIGTEHLLMGLLKEVQGTAGMVLAEYGVEEERLIELIDRLIAPSGTVAPRGEKSPFTRHHIGSSASTKSSRMVLVMLSIKDWWLR